MAEFTPLATNYKDDILASSNTRRKYQQTDNSDGTKSFTDVTSYKQTGSPFGAADINKTNKAINDIYANRILDTEDLELVTETGFFVDALVVKAILDTLSTLFGAGAVFKVQPSPSNLVYGAYDPGIYYFDGDADGAPVSGYDGVMLTFRRTSTSNMIKLALSTDGSINRMVQRSSGEVAQSWRSVW